jgi:hypothetical protein
MGFRVFFGKRGAVLTIVSILAATVLTAGHAQGQESGAALRDIAKDSSNSTIAKAQSSIQGVATRVAHSF